MNIDQHQRNTKEQQRKLNTIKQNSRNSKNLDEHNIKSNKINNYLRTYKNHITSTKNERETQKSTGNTMNGNS